MSGTDMMNQQASDAFRPAAVPKNGADHRLDSWKEIASYLGRSARCVQRWEKNLGLPVHRIHHIEGYTVYAYVAELEAWRQSRERVAAPLNPEHTTANADSHPDQAITTVPSRWSTSVIGFRRLLGKVVPLRAARS